jgi:hypothetical protein
MHLTRFGFVSCSNHEAATVYVSEMAVAARCGPLIGSTPSSSSRSQMGMRSFREYTLASFNDLVGAREQRDRHVQAKRLRGLEVDNQNLSANCTGRLAGVSPFSTRST